MNGPKVPQCPNGQPAIMYDDGRPVLCLPGQKHCPPGSGCYFNGLDFFCCPETDDPYSKHAFGGDGSETSKEATPKFQNLQVSPGGAVPGLASLPPAPLIVGPPGSSQDFQSGGHKQNCLQPRDSGPCRGSHLRWFYKPSVDACRLFYYGGCEGNSNNFATKQNCVDECVQGQRIVRHRGCRNGQLPLGGTSPVQCGGDGLSLACPVGFSCQNEVCCADTGTADLQSVGPPSVGARPPGDSLSAPQETRVIGEPSLPGQVPGTFLPDLIPQPIGDKNNLIGASGKFVDAPSLPKPVVQQSSSRLEPQTVQVIPPGISGFPVLGPNQVILLVPENIPQSPVSPLEAAPAAPNAIVPPAAAKVSSGADVDVQVAHAGKVLAAVVPSQPASGPSAVVGSPTLPGAAPVQQQSRPVVPKLPAIGAPSFGHSPPSFDPNTAGLPAPKGVGPQVGCPDGSRPLTTPTGEPRACGAGFDGAPLCPAGYFCMIDLYVTLRLCCPLSGPAAHAAPFPLPAPRRPHKASDFTDPLSVNPDPVAPGSRGIGSGPGFVVTQPDPYAPPGLPPPMRHVLGETFPIETPAANIPSVLVHQAAPGSVIREPSVADQHPAVGSVVTSERIIHISRDCS